MGTGMRGLESHAEAHLKPHFPLRLCQAMSEEEWWLPSPTLAVTSSMQTANHCC